MKISVVIPALNEEHYLPACLEALFKQTIKPYEVIVVDNGSTDRTSAVARKYHAKVIYEPHRGIIPARQAGFKAARGQIIARTDADGIASGEWLSRVGYNFTHNPSLAAFTGPIVCYDLPFGFNGIASFMAQRFMKIISRPLGHPLLVGGNFAVRKDIFDKITPHTDDSQVHEDFDISCHIANIGTIGYDPLFIMNYSSRRIRNNPFSFFGEYPIRLLKTLYLHHHYFVGPHRKDI